jgi:hypothetical protein
MKYVLYRFQKTGQKTTKKERGKKKIFYVLRAGCSLYRVASSKV